MSDFSQHRCPDRLLDLGWTPETAETFAPYERSHQPARVCRIDRGGADLAGAAGAIRATYGGDVLRAGAADRSAMPAVGDWCVVRDWPDGRVTLDAVLERRTAIVRDSAGTTSHGQVVVANVDRVVIVEHLDPDPDLGRIERLLVLAWASGARPLVILTKSDLVPDPDGMRAEVAAVAPGVDVLAVSAATGDGVEAFFAQLAPGRTLALLGPSGAGKSTLTNLVARTPMVATGATRERDGKGRHVTTHRQLIVVPGRGVVIDTPGLRSIGIVADDAAVATTFPEIEELAEQCRFRDCAHETEPGCAVLAAVADGELDEQRVTRWRKLGREAEFHARRADARLRAQEAAAWKRRLGRH